MIARPVPKLGRFEIGPQSLSSITLDALLESDPLLSSKAAMLCCLKVPRELGPGGADHRGLQAHSRISNTDTKLLIYGVHHHYLSGTGL